MNARSPISLLFVAACLLPGSAIAQDLARDINIYNYQPWIVTGKVTTLRGDPVARARVEVEPTSVSGELRTLMTNFQGEFKTEYRLNTEMVKEFAFEVNVTKKGLRGAHLLLDFGSPDKAWVIPITLRDVEEDTQLLSQADLTSGLAPKLMHLGASDGLSPAGEKDYARGVTEFLELKRPDRALPFFTKVARRDPSCIPCRTMLALAQLDSGDWDGTIRNLDEVVNKILKDRSLGRPEPLVALGVMESWRHKPVDSAGYFAEALKYAPQDLLALQELGRSQLLIQNWGPAQQYLAKAVTAGAKPEVRLLRIQALLGGDQVQAADAEMANYLDGRDVRKMPIQVRQLWAQIESRKKVDAVYVMAKPKDDQGLDYLHRPPSGLVGLQPAADQAPLNSILSAVGKSVAELFANFPNTSSLEEIHQAKLRHNQKASATLDQKFRYLCFTPSEDWGLGFDEYRTDLTGHQAWPQGLVDGFMLTSGFASTALVFHPRYQSQAAFRYLGRQKVNGRDNHVVAFAQLPAKALLRGVFVRGETSMTTFSQGLAWIDSQTYQITRLRTDLLKPLPQINLERVTTEIAFGEVRFKGLDAGVWIPQHVTVAVDWNGKHLRNDHRYSEFKLFKVEERQKVGTPKDLGQVSNPEPPSQVTR